MWRMYIVWERSWKVVILPVSLLPVSFYRHSIINLQFMDLLVHICMQVIVSCRSLCYTYGHSSGCAYAAAILLTKPDTGIYSPVQLILSFLGWPLELVVDICVAGAIIGRLWCMGRAMSRVLSETSQTLGVSNSNAYVSPIFTIIESGAIVMAVSLTMMALYKTGNPAALMCLDIATQIAVGVQDIIVLEYHELMPCVCRFLFRTSSSFVSGLAQTVSASQALRCRRWTGAASDLRQICSWSLYREFLNIWFLE